MKDLLGRPLDGVERRILGAYEEVCDLLRTADLAPTSRANLSAAATALWVLVDELGLRFERPDDLHL